MYRGALERVAISISNQQELKGIFDNFSMNTCRMADAMMVLSSKLLTIVKLAYVHTYCAKCG